MEMRHLQSFIALAEEGTFTAAARKMNIVQSGISVTIKEMEQELGVQLVKRTTRSLSLTHAGQLFLAHARSSLATLSDGIRAVRSEDGIVRGRLHLAILQSLEPYVNLPLLLQTFRNRYPEVEFAVRSLNNEEVLVQVRSGHMDLGFHAVVEERELAGVKIIPLAQDSLVAICSRTHALAKRSTVTLDALAGETFVDLTAERALRRLVDLSCSQRHLRRNSVYQVSGVETLLQFVSAGLGVAVVPASLARMAAQSRPLQLLTFVKQDRSLPMWRVVIVTRSHQSRLPGKKTTVDLFLEALAKQTDSAQGRTSRRRPA